MVAPCVVAGSWMSGGWLVAGAVVLWSWSVLVDVVGFVWCLWWIASTDLQNFLCNVRHRSI
jgi:hypothetical protein